MLVQLFRDALADAATREAELPLSAVVAAVQKAAAPRDGVQALTPGKDIKIIAEIKRASPSRGTLAEIPDPVELALKYQAGGASVISVLTEGRRFGGSLAELAAVRSAVELPVLRKDFIGNEYQVFEARAAGADLVLLIVAGLDAVTLRQLYNLIIDLRMTPLVEIHNAEELARAAELGAKLIGVNARSLSTFELDRDIFGLLAPSFPTGAIKLAESAVLSREDVLHYRRAGADAVLIGESLVTSDPIATLQEFLRSEHETE